METIKKQRDETNPQVTEASDVPLPQLQSENGLDKAVAVCAAHVAAADVDVAGVESFRQSLVEKDSGWSGIAAAIAASFAVIHDHTVVDESESEDESMSESGSEFLSERSDNHEVEAAVGLQPRSISLLDASSLTQYEVASVLCAHPRPPCPAEKGLSTGAATVIGTSTGTPRQPSPTEEDISTGAAAAIGMGNGTAVTGVGAIAAFLAGRNHRRAITESENDTSRDIDEETSIDSQHAAAPRDVAPSAYECLRPTVQRERSSVLFCCSCNDRWSSRRCCSQ